MSLRQACMKLTGVLATLIGEFNPMRRIADDREWSAEGSSALCFVRGRAFAVRSTGSLQFPGATLPLRGGFAAGGCAALLLRGGFLAGLRLMLLDRLPALLAPRLELLLNPVVRTLKPAFIPGRAI